VPDLPVIVAEDDPFTRHIQIVLDPSTSPERIAAFADFMAVDEPDFAGWCERVRKGSPGLHPAEVRMVTSEAEMRAKLADACALVVEGFRVGSDDLAAAPRLRAVQKYGAILRNIDAAACAERSVKVLALRRRANVSCAEQTFALMLALARKLDRLIGTVTPKRIKAAGYTLRPFDRRHTPGANYARVAGLRPLHGTTIGIIGLGEIGREIALRAAAFEMRVLYYQRTRLPESEERQFRAAYRPLHALLAESDWIAPQVPRTPSTRGLIGRDELSKVKLGACIVNVADAAIIDREPLIDALREGRVGGFALDPAYHEPMAEDDELLQLDNVIITPHMGGSPRFNGLNDLEELITGLARAVAS
jgi:phosphoglycerate dehydrogenase-like enzyme